MKIKLVLIAVLLLFSVGGAYGFPLSSTWINNDFYVNGIVGVGGDSAPSVFYIGDELYMISGGVDGLFYAYNWNGSTWNANTTLINGFADVGSSSTPSIFEYSGILRLITSSSAQTYTAYDWSGSYWNSNATFSIICIK